jgi:predicted metal-dependent peptidase
MTITKLDKAKVAIVTQHPFFASILLKRKLIEDNSIPTAAVDQRGQIYYNKDFIEKLSVDQAVFLLAHEVGHVIGQHAARRGARQARRWNIAGDAWINDMLKDAGIGDFITGGVDMPGSKDDTVDAIYNRLPEDQGGEDGSGRVPGIGEDLIERGSPLTGDEADKIDAEIRVEVAQAAQAAKMQGKMPASLQKIIADLIDPGTPWYEILERYMTSFKRGEVSWARPNRRFDQYLPSPGKVAEMGEVVIQIDVSGSISPRELNYYNGHLARIIELCAPERVHVLYVDTAVCKHDTFERGEEFALEFYAGGGTDMEAGFKYIEDKGIDPEVFVCLTDGYTDFNASSKPAYPVVWCISTDVEAPYGDVIHFTMDAS